MSKYRQINNIAHNFTHSFMSLMSDCDDFEYLTNALIINLYANGLERINMDLLKGMELQPEIEVSNNLRMSLDYQGIVFHTLVKRHQLPINYINRATILVEATFPEASDIHGDKGCVTVVYTCTTTIEDNKGRNYQTTITYDESIARRHLNHV